MLEKTRKGKDAKNTAILRFYKFDSVCERTQLPGPSLRYSSELHCASLLRASFSRVHRRVHIHNIYKMVGFCWTTWLARDNYRPVIKVVQGIATRSPLQGACKPHLWKHRCTNTWKFKAPGNGLLLILINIQIKECSGLNWSLKLDSDI